jgi:hypothetical protein
LTPSSSPPRPILEPQISLFRFFSGEEGQPSIFLLTRWLFPKGQWQSLLLLFGGGAAFFVVWGWLLPVVEIAPRGQSRFEVFRRTVIAITVGLIGAGFAKLLFG